MAGKMAEYISREALLKMIGTMPSSPITDREERLIRAFISTVKNFPAADVREVKRGKWTESVVKYDELTSLFGFKCSECGGFCIGESNFCPNCGADMREGQT